MSAYRDHERLRGFRARVDRTVELASSRLPAIQVRRRSRVVVGALGGALGIALHALLLSGGSWIDRWALASKSPLLAAPAWGLEDGAVGPSWRPWALALALGAVLSAWAITSLRARSERREFTLRMQQARGRDALEPFLAEELRRLERQEPLSAALPLALVAFLAPLVLHGVMILGVGLRTFDGWMSLAVSAFGAQLALAVLAYRTALRWRSLGMRSLETDESWRRSFWVAIPLAMLGSAARFAATTSAAPLAACVFVAVSTGAVAAATYAFFWPLANLAMCRTLVRERLELDDVRLALESLGEAATQA